MSLNDKLDTLPTLFTKEDLKQVNLNPKICRSKKIKRHSKGVWHQVDQNFDELTHTLAICRSNQGCVITSITAAKIHQMRLPPKAIHMEEIHLLTGQRHKRVQIQNVVSSQAALSHDEITYFLGTAVTTPARTFLELGKIFTELELLYIAEGLVRCHPHRAMHKKPIISKEKLLAYLYSKKGVRGVAKCKWAVENAKTGSDSWKETELRLLLEEYGITDLTTNQPKYDEQGRYLFEADLGDETYRISIQYEGAHHRENHQMLSDRNRLKRTNLYGWEEVRVYSQDLYEKEWWQGQYLPRAVVLVLEARQKRGAKNLHFFQEK